MLLEGKRAVVTGGSRGIGCGTAVELARQSADVVISYHAEANRAIDAEAAEETVAPVEALGRGAVAVEGGTGNPSTFHDLVAVAVRELGEVDVLACKAGICPFHAFLDMPAGPWQPVLDVDLSGAFYVPQAAANRMKYQGTGGAIVATSSLSAPMGGGMQTHYTSTKAGVHSPMQSVAIVLGPHGIRSNSVLPGALASDISSEDWSNPQKRAHLNSRIPLGRFGEPSDKGKAVASLASDVASYVTGAAPRSDGGLFVSLQ